MSQDNLREKAVRSSVIDCGYHSHQPMTKGPDHDRRRPSAVDRRTVACDASINSCIDHASPKFRRACTNRAACSRARNFKRFTKAGCGCFRRRAAEREASRSTSIWRLIAESTQADQRIWGCTGGWTSADGHHALMADSLISGCLFIFINRVSLKHIRPGQLQEHQAGRRDSIHTPLGYGLWRYFANLRHRGSSAERVNNVIRVHCCISNNQTKKIVSMLTEISKHTFVYIL